MVFFGTSAVHHRSVPYDATFSGQRPVWRHLRDPCHGSILLHDARCMGDGDNYSGPPCIAILIFDFFCMISSISKGGVKFHIWM